MKTHEEKIEKFREDFFAAKDEYETLVCDLRPIIISMLKIEAQRQKCCGAKRDIAILQIKRVLQDLLTLEDENNFINCVLEKYICELYLL